MLLRKGLTKAILESSIDSALLAVDVYNKPRTVFRSENYITLMIIAWTKLFHAYFHHTIGNKFFYKEDGRYKLINGERKAWELATCIKKYGQLKKAVEENLRFFIGLRNKIEHRAIEKREFDTIIFGECQSMLYNYETLLIELFGEEYAINENLVYSLQFSQMRTPGQKQANKTILSKDVQEIREYIHKYRESMPAKVFESQEFSIKLIQVPKIVNASKSDLAVEFVQWDSLNPDDRENYNKLDVIIKDKVVKREGTNVGRHRTKDIIKKVKERTSINFNQYTHMCLYTIFSIRPTNKENTDPFETNTVYCHYDEPHNDYLYQDRWVEFIVRLLNSGKLSADVIKEHYKNSDKLNIAEYE